MLILKFLKFLPFPRNNYKFEIYEHLKHLPSKYTLILISVCIFNCIEIGLSWQSEQYGKDVSDKTY